LGACASVARELGQASCHSPGSLPDSASHSTTMKNENTSEAGRQLQETTKNSGTTPARGAARPKLFFSDVAERRASISQALRYLSVLVTSPLARDRARAELEEQLSLLSVVEALLRQQEVDEAQLLWSRHFV